jgi:retron-type reverse transcriptase
MRRVGWLFDQVVDYAALRAAAHRAARGKRRRPEVAAFLVDEERYLLTLRRELEAGTYQPGAHATFTVHDPKTRLISAPPFRDRVVHHALCHVLEPVLERVAIPDSYACRKGKGSHAAILRAQALAKQHPFALHLDVRRFFDSVDHGVLKTLVRRLIKDARILDLVDRIIDHGPPGRPPGKGLPIGNLTSQHLANLYLSSLDHHVKEVLHARAYVRYMDDLLLLGEKHELWQWREAIEQFLSDRLLLTLKPEATTLAPVTEGITFLGLRLFPGVIRLTPRSRRRLVRVLRRASTGEREHLDPEPRRIASVASRVGHTRIADAFRLRRKVVSESLTRGRSSERARTG